MSFKTALASCWDVCKRNCTFVFFERPEFNSDLYETYYSPSLYKGYPYNEKGDRNSNYIGLTALDDKLVSSFLGWVFAIPEMLVWLSVGLGMVLLSALTFVPLLVGLLTAPVFFRLTNGKLKFHPDYTDFLENTWSFGQTTAAYAFFSFLRVPYHFLKALIRIPAGVVLGVQEIVSPLLVSEANAEDVNNFEERPYFFNGLFGDAGSTEVPVQSGTNQFVFEYTSDSEDEQDEVATSGFEERISQLEERISRLQRQRDMRLSEDESDLDRAIRNSDYENHAPSAPVQVAQTSNLDEGLIKLLETIQIPSRYQCSISFDLIQSPFLVADGHFYNRSHIEAHFASSGLNSPLTRQSIPPSNPQGIVLENVQNEINAFAYALQKKHKSDGEKGVAEVLAIANKIGKQADELRKAINQQIKNRHKNDFVIPEHNRFIKKMPSTGSADEYLIVSSDAIAKTWSYVKVLTGTKSSTDLSSLLTMSPEKALESFFTLIEKIDSSFDNLIINALREAILEEQQVAKEFDKTWQEGAVNTLKAASDLPNALLTPACGDFDSVFSKESNVATHSITNVAAHLAMPRP